MSRAQPFQARPLLLGRRDNLPRMLTNPRSAGGCSVRADCVLQVAQIKLVIRQE